MALAECIARAGDALSADDRTFLESQLADGATDEDALNSLQESVAASITVVAQRVQSEGGKIATEPPALPDKPQFYSQTYETDSPLFYSAAERAVETMNLPGWKASKKNPEARAFGHEIWEKIKASGLLNACLYQAPPITGPNPNEAPALS